MQYSRNRLIYDKKHKKIC